MLIESKAIKNLMDEILQNRRIIYGILACWILLFHIADRVPVPGDPGVIGPLIRMGNVCVDIFLFLSGYCICRSYERSQTLIEFYKKRVIRVIIPYLIIAIPLYLWKDGFETGWALDLQRYIADILTYSFWTGGMQTTWFVCAIILFYTIFPLLYKMVKKSKYAGIILIGIIWIINILLSLNWTGYRLTMIAWTRLPVFILGITCYVNGVIADISKKQLIVFVLIAFVFTVVFPIRERYQAVFGNRPQVLFISYIFLVPGILYSMSELILKMPNILRAFFDSIGDVSLEMYLIHIFILRIMDYFKIAEKIGGFYYLLAFTVTIICVQIYKKLLLSLRKYPVRMK